MIFQDAIPHLKTFLKPAALRRRAQALVIRCIVAFLIYRGTMSASRPPARSAPRPAIVPRSVGSSAAAIGSGPICWALAALIDLEAQRDGLFILDMEPDLLHPAGPARREHLQCNTKTTPEEQPQAEEIGAAAGRATAS